MHLLGKKSWNVYNTDNVARVRRDEAEAKLREEEEERRQQEIDSERRLDLLRGIKPRDLPDVEPKSDPPRPARRNDVDRKVKKRKLPGEDDTDRDIRLARLEAETSRNYKTVERSITDTSLKDQKGNINLFADERGRVEKNDEAEKEAQKKKREYEDQYTMRFSNAAGGREGVRTPWYSTTTQTPLDTSTKDVWGNDDPMRQKREQARNASNDPLAAMKKGVRQLKEAEKERAAWKAERDRETALSLDQSLHSSTDRKRIHGSTELDDIDGFDLNNEARKSREHKHRRRESRPERHGKRRRSKSPSDRSHRRRHRSRHKHEHRSRSK